MSQQSSESSEENSRADEETPSSSETETEDKSDVDSVVFLYLPEKENKSEPTTEKIETILVKLDSLITNSADTETEQPDSALFIDLLTGGIVGIETTDSANSSSPPDGGSLEESSSERGSLETESLSSELETTDEEAAKDEGIFVDVTCETIESKDEDLDLKSPTVSVTSSPSPKKTKTSKLNGNVKCTKLPSTDSKTDLPTTPTSRKNEPPSSPLVSSVGIEALFSFSGELLRKIIEIPSRKMEEKIGESAKEDKGQKSERKTYWDSPLLSSVNLFPAGPRFKLVKEADINAHQQNDIKSMLRKIINTHLRHFDGMNLSANAKQAFKTTSAKVLSSMDYSGIKDLYVISTYEFADKCYLRIVLGSKSYLFQTEDEYTRNSWYHFIVWKKKMYRYQRILCGTTDIETLVRELQNFVEFILTTTMQGKKMYEVAVVIVSRLLQELQKKDLDEESREQLIMSMQPLLDQTKPSEQICLFLSEHCRRFPLSSVIPELSNTSIYNILIHSVDFSRNLHTRKLLQDYIKALSYQEHEEVTLKKFVARIHGPNFKCPHKLIMVNLASTCLSAIASCFECSTDVPTESFACYVDVLCYMSEYSDWLTGVAEMLRPVPIHFKSLNSKYFMRKMAYILARIVQDPRCNTHSQLTGARPDKKGWIDVFCPSNKLCPDDGTVWADMVGRLLKCYCHRRKSFLVKLAREQLDSCLLLALRGHNGAQVAICMMLEWNVIEDDQRKWHIMVTLKSTESGRAHYDSLYERIEHVKKLQEKGGPVKLTLPGSTTDQDLKQLFSNGSYGSLEHLSLAFTHITNASAETLIKLTHLKHLNLWSTNFGDDGVMTISEHLVNLRELNLCETLVTDKGIAALTAFVKLERLNLNSTKLSTNMLSELKAKLPNLVHLDSRYTEAW